MSKNQMVINPSTSGIQIKVEFPILSEHKKLVTKNRDNLKLPEHPLDLNTLVISKLIALLTEEDPMLNLIVKALQNKVDKVNANSHYLNQFIEELHESDGLFYMHGRDNLKLPEHPLDLNTLVISKLIALLTEEDPMLNLIVKALQNKVDKVNANSHYLNQFIEELQESDGLFYNS